MDKFLKVVRKIVGIAIITFIICLIMLLILHNFIPIESVIRTTLLIGLLISLLVCLCVMIIMFVVLFVVGVKKDKFEYVLSMLRSIVLYAMVFGLIAVIFKRQDLMFLVIVFTAKESIQKYLYNGKENLFKA